MENVRINELEQYMGPAVVLKPVYPELGGEHVNLIYYELEPDDILYFGYYRHENQEEVFYVQKGTITFETEEGDVEVESGDVIRFAPGEWKGGTNTGTERAVVLAIGAPPDRGETTFLRECPECGERTPQEIEMTEARDLLTIHCEACGTETGRFT